MKNHFAGSVSGIIFLLSLWMMPNGPVMAQDPPQKEYVSRIEKLEQRLELKQELDGVAKELREQQFKNIEQQYVQAIEKLRNEQQAYKNEVQEKNLLIYVTWAFMAVVGFGSFFQIRRWTKDEVSKQVGDVLKSESDLVRQIIDSQALENRLKEQKSLLVISGSSAAMGDLEREFKAMHFKQVTSRLFHTVFDLDNNTFKPDFHEDEYELIVLNQLTEDQINRYVDKSKQAIFLGFSYEYLKNIKEREKLNFANSSFTLYARIMEVLKYRYITERH